MRPPLTVSETVPDDGAFPTEHSLRVGLASLDGVRGACAVFLGALLLYGVQSLAVGLSLGRDVEDYVIQGWELFRDEPLFPKLMLSRTPVSGVVVDGAYAVGGAVGLEVGLALLFAGAVTLWVAAARAWSRKAAVAMFVLLAVVPAYGLFFHRVSSDPVFAAALGIVAFLSVRVASRPRVAPAVALGLAVSLVVLTRPSGQPFLLLAALPLGLALPWRRRLGLAVAVGLTAVAVVAAWAVTNGIRYGEVTVAHGGKSGIPLYRVFVIDPRVAEANGPATRELARVVRTRLLPMEPYRSYGFDTEEVLRAKSVWVLDDIVFAAEAEYGATEGADLLFRAGVEGVRAAPGAYAEGVGLGLAGLLLLPYSPGVASAPGVPASVREITDAVVGTPGRGRRLPPEAASTTSVWAQAMVKSWELEATERYRISGGLEPLEGAIWPQLERRRLDWSSPVDVERYRMVRERLRAFVDDVSTGDRHPGAAQSLRVAGLLLPAAGFWLLVALVFAIRFRRPGLWAPALVAVASLLVLLETALAFPPHPDYALPFVPVFVLLALAAIVGRPRSVSGGAYPPAA